MAGMEEQPGVREIDSVEGLRALADPGLPCDLVRAGHARPGRVGAAWLIPVGSGSMQLRTVPLELVNVS